VPHPLVLVCLIKRILLCASFSHTPRCDQIECNHQSIQFTYSNCEVDCKCSTLKFLDSLGKNNFFENDRKIL
jgi:hypothetical protein